MDSEQILFWVGVAVAVANPVITALVVKADARKTVKVVVSLVLALVAGVVAAVSQWSTADLPTLLAASFGVAQLAYRVADTGFQISTGAGINEQDVMRPQRGLA